MTDSVDRVLAEMRVWLDGMPLPMWQVGLAVLAVVLATLLIKAWRKP